jgi:hypothetical protein
VLVLVLDSSKKLSQSGGCILKHKVPPLGTLGYKPKSTWSASQGCLNRHPTVKFTVQTSARVRVYPADAFLPVNGFLSSALTVKKCVRMDAPMRPFGCANASARMRQCLRADTSAFARTHPCIRAEISTSTRMGLRVRADIGASVSPPLLGSLLSPHLPYADGLMRPHGRSADARKIKN